MFAGIGGGEVSLYNTLTHMNPSRFRPMVLIPEEGPLTSRLRAAGVDTIVVPFPVVPLRALIRPRTFWSCLTGSFRLRKIIARLHPDIIQCSDVLSLLLLVPFAAGRRSPAVVFNVLFFYEQSRKALFNLLAIPFVHRIIVNSEAVGIDLRSHSVGLRKKITAHYNGVDTDIFRPLSADERHSVREQFNLKQKSSIIALIGRYDVWKGHRTFIAAAEQLARKHPEYAFLIAGGSTTDRVLAEVEQYRKEILNLAEPLVREGKLTIIDHTDAIAPLIGCLDAIVYPSDREPYGLVLLEAYSSGIPVVASSTVGALEALGKQEFLYTVPPRDAASLAHAIEMAVSLKPEVIERDKMHDLMKIISWDRYTAGICREFEALLARKERTDQIVID